MAKNIAGQKYSIQEIFNLIFDEDSKSLSFFQDRRVDSFHITLDATSSTSAQTVKAGVASKSIYITDVSISTDTAQSVKLQDDTGTPIIITPRKFLPANSVWSKQFRNPVQVAIGKSVNIVCGGSSGNVTVELDGYII